MITEKKFSKIKKIDAHNHMNLGMFPEDYMNWAGFRIPNFPRVFNGLDEMHEIIINYTRPRCVTADDVRSLICMSVEAAISDNVAILEGSVDIGFIRHCEGNIDAFLRLVQEVREKYADKIDFRPELGIAKVFDINMLREWIPECLNSKVFLSMDLYGPEVEDGIENFVPFYELATKLGVKKKAHVGEFSDAASVRRFTELFNLEEIQHGIGAAKDDSVLQFLKDRDVRLNVTPTSNVMLSAVPSLKEHPIRKLVDAGLRITIGTDDLLFFNRTVGQQAADLVNEGILTEDEVKTCMKQK